MNDFLVLIPCYNEQGAIPKLIAEVQAAVPGAPILVADDHSQDATVSLARAAGAGVLALPHHLGLGGVVQAGYRLAYELGYQYVVRVDGDGQHKPADIPRVLEALKTSGCEMAIGSRFVEGGGREHSSFLRSLVIAFFRAVLRVILGKPVYDPTSGFVAVNRAALEVFSHSFPLEYPEIETLVVLQRKRFRFIEVPCSFRARTTGRTSITPSKSLYFILHVMLGVFVNILRFDGRRR